MSLCTRFRLELDGGLHMASSVVAELGQRSFTLPGLRAAACQSQGLLRLPPSLQSGITAFLGGMHPCKIPTISAINHRPNEECPGIGRKKIDQLCCPISNCFRHLYCLFLAENSRDSRRESRDLLRDKRSARCNYSLVLQNFLSPR